MKLKNQKILLQRFGLLLLLLLGGTLSSESSEKNPVAEEENSISLSPEVNELDADLSEIGLSVLGYQPFDIRQYFLTTDYSFSSSYEAALASNYISNSSLIDPGLDDCDIVFPFHFYF